MILTMILKRLLCQTEHITSEYMVRLVLVLLCTDVFTDLRKLLFLVVRVLKKIAPEPSGRMLAPRE